MNPGGDDLTLCVYDLLRPLGEVTFNLPHRLDAVALHDDCALVGR